MAPAFDLSIHDYVVKCGTAPTLQFTAQLPSGETFSLLTPAEPTAGSSTSTGGMFQRSLTLLPGQRFRFLLGGESDEYSVRCLPETFPDLTVSITGTEAPQAQFYLFAPDISISAPGFAEWVILTDAHGTPVWWMVEPSGAADDAKILGKNQIAWTTTSTYGVGGAYAIRDFSGIILNKLIGGLDDHDLQPTGAGTYLAIRDVPRICPPDCADMSPWGGSSQTAAVDAQIVELDSASNVLWTWNTRDHITLAETGNAGWFPGVGEDIIHMNALEVDGNDGILFSARHLNAIYHITKSTGTIDWKIGGTARNESLIVLGDTRPSATGPSGQVLSGQHDVRKWPDGTVSVHDNGTIANRPPFVLRYQIDIAAQTATVVESFEDPRAPASGFTGSARRLPDGHWLVQWGDLPFLTELDSNANPVLTIEYNLGSGFSYRAVPVLAGTLDLDMLRAGMDFMSLTKSCILLVCP